MSNEINEFFQTLNSVYDQTASPRPDSARPGKYFKKNANGRLEESEGRLSKLSGSGGTREPAVHSQVRSHRIGSVCARARERKRTKVTLTCRRAVLQRVHPPVHQICVDVWKYPASSHSFWTLHPGSERANYPRPPDQWACVWCEKDTRSVAAAKLWAPVGWHTWISACHSQKQSHR